MKQFRYRAVDSHGEAIDGSIEAQSLHDASQKLRAAEVAVTSIADAGDERRYEPDGPRPGPAPRAVEVRFRDMPGGRLPILIAGAFTAMALLFIMIGVGLLLAGDNEGLFFTIFPLIHLAVGLGLLRHVVNRRTKRQHLYRDGHVAMATVDGVGYNRSMRINGRNPREMTWSFDVDGDRFHDKCSSFDDRISRFAPGDRIWVLYDPADPEASAEWPPFTR